MHTIGCETTLGGGHDRLAELIRIGRDVSGGIEPLDTRLLTLVDDKTTLSILVSV
jgi:hypothetical protein